MTCHWDSRGISIQTILNTNHVDFEKENVPFKGMKAEEIFSLSFHAICFVRVWVNLKVQTVFLYQSLWHAVQVQAGVERRAVRDPPQGHVAV